MEREPRAAGPVAVERRPAGRGHPPLPAGAGAAGGRGAGKRSWLSWSSTGPPSRRNTAPAPRIRQRPPARHQRRPLTCPAPAPSLPPAGRRGRLPPGLPRGGADATAHRRRNGHDGLPADGRQRPGGLGHRLRLLGAGRDELRPHRRSAGDRGHPPRASTSASPCSTPRPATASATPRRCSAAPWGRGARTWCWSARRPSAGTRSPSRRKLDCRYSTVKRIAEESLRRLGTDHLDLLLIHWPDVETPLEETMRALTDLVAEGQDAPRRRLQLHRLRAARVAAGYAPDLRQPGGVQPVRPALGAGDVPHRPGAGDRGHGLRPAGPRAAHRRHGPGHGLRPARTGAPPG